MFHICGLATGNKEPSPDIAASDCSLLTPLAGQWEQQLQLKNTVALVL